MVNAVDLLSGAVLLYVGVNLVVGFRRSLHPALRARQLEIVRGLRPRHFLPVPVVLTLVIAAANLLVAIPGLSFGWWQAIGGAGNPAIGMTDSTSGTPLAAIIPIVFIVLILATLPLLVEREEVWFRAGSESRSHAQLVVWAFAFGLVHVLVGVPIGVGIALSIGGAWFTRAYLREFRKTGSRRAALLESTRCHFAYDVLLFVAILTWVVTTGGLDS